MNELLFFSVFYGFGSAGLIAGFVLGSCIRAGSSKELEMVK